MKNEKNDWIDELLKYGVHYYNQFILPTKKYRPTPEEKGWIYKIIVFLKKHQRC